MEAHLLAGQVRREVATLPEGQRMAVFLVYGEGMSALCAVLWPSRPEWM